MAWIAIVRRMLLATVPALLLGSSLLGCERKEPAQPPSAEKGAPSEGDAKTITLGAISPFTGDGAPYGKAARTGIDLALDELNAAGGVNGAKLAVVYEDDQGTPTGALNAFEKLVTVNKVPAILGPFYSGNVMLQVQEKRQ